MTICPKCKYERKETDMNPEWECPSCGVAYVKVQKTAKDSYLEDRSFAKKTHDTQLKASKNNAQVKFLITCFVCLIIGYFSGREHLKYEIKSSLRGAFSGIEKGFIEEKVSDIKAFLKPNFVTPIISNKHLEKNDYEEFIWLDVTWETSELKKPTRAIKGVLVFSDLFGETKFQVRKTINKPLTANSSLTEEVGFNYNKFKDSDRWMLSTDLNDMTFKYDVTNIIYTDGTSESFE